MTHDPGKSLFNPEDPEDLRMLFPGGEENALTEATLYRPYVCTEEEALAVVLAAGPHKVLKAIEEEDKKHFLDTGAIFHPWLMVKKPDGSVRRVSLSSIAVEATCLQRVDRVVEALSRIGSK